jgi:hypothetical protein
VAGFLVRLAAVAGAVVLAGAPGAAAQSPPPAGSIGLRLVEVPVGAIDDPRAHLYVIDHVAPGTTIERQIEVSNTSAGTADVQLYAAAAAIEAGRFGGAAGHEANDLSSWTTTSPSSVAVEAGGVVAATVTIEVPGDAPPGEQYAVVWAEVRTTPPAGGVVQVHRVGIRIYLSVGPGGAPAADFSVDSMRAGRDAAGRPTVVVSVRNTGGRAVDLSGTLALGGGPSGLRAGPFAVDLGSTLAVGVTEQLEVTLDAGLPDGPWEAVVVLRSGLVERTGTATLSFPAEGSSAPVPVAPPPTGGGGRLVPALGLVLGLAIPIGVARKVRRTRSVTPRRGGRRRSSPAPA